MNSKNKQTIKPIVYLCICNGFGESFNVWQYRSKTGKALSYLAANSLLLISNGYDFICFNIGHNNIYFKIFVKFPPFLVVWIPYYGIHTMESIVWNP